MSEDAPSSGEDPDAFAARYFDAVSPFYDGVTTGDGSDWTPNRVLAEVLAPYLRPGMTALDIGAGTGQTVEVLLTALAPEDATAIDVSEGMLQELRQRFPQVHTFTGTVEGFAAAARVTRFDVITAVGALEFVEDLAAFLAASGRLLRAGGLLAVTYLPTILFHRHQGPAGSGGRNTPFAFTREPGEVARVIAASGLELVRDLELVSYREAGEPIVYHLVLARRR